MADDRKDVTVPMPESLADEIESQLGYGDSRAGWIREAIRQRLEREQEEEIDEGKGNPNTHVISS